MKYYFYFNKLFSGDDDQLPNLRQKLGWIMGHTEEELIIDATEVVFKNNIQLSRVNYANLVVDDFQNNFYSKSSSVVLLISTLSSITSCIFAPFFLIKYI